MVKSRYPTLLLVLSRSHTAILSELQLYGHRLFHCFLSFYGDFVMTDEGFVNRMEILPATVSGFHSLRAIFGLDRIQHI